MVICQICQQQFKRVTRTHLVKHGLTTQQYKSKFPESEMISSELKIKYGQFFRENNPMKLKEVQDRISKARTGMKFSEEHCKNISAARRGKSTGKRSIETKSKIGCSNKATNILKKEQGYVRPKSEMSPSALQKASDRMKGNTLGKHGNHNKGKKLNLTIEQRRNRSEKRVAYLASNKNIRSGTKPELEFIKWLTETKIQFEHQYPIHTASGSWLYDFWLPDMNLLVEIDGEYWHTTKQSIRRDEIKNKIAKELGKIVARISTDDLDFSSILLNKDEIWEHNENIIIKRKKKYE